MAPLIAANDTDIAHHAADLRRRYASMTPREIAERAIYLEGYVYGLIGAPAPDADTDGEATGA